MAQPTYQPPQEEEINLREELQKYLVHWPWFIGAVIVCLLFAGIYLKTSTPTYRTTASIIIEDEDSKSPSSELAAFADLGLLSGLTTNIIENEMGILRSKRMMTNTVKALNLQTQYFKEEHFTTYELYLKTPYLVEILRLDEKKLLNLLKEEEKVNQFRIIKEEDQLFLQSVVTEAMQKVTEDTPVDIGYGDIVITQNLQFIPPEDEEELSSVLVKLSTVENVVDTYREKLEVNLVDKNATLIELGLEDPVRQKAQDILDQLILEYNREAIIDKNLVATNTAKFIDERLEIINQELDSVETGKESFKETNKLTDIQAESVMFIENASEYKKRQQEVGTQLELANAMIRYLKSGSGSELLPANLGIQEAGINSQIEDYNNFILERDRILSASTQRNPTVVRINAQINSMQGAILQSLERSLANLKIAQEDLDREMKVIGSEISAVPSKEREFRGIERQQNIKEALYLFLLEKREENSLSLAVTAPKAKIVDAAYSTKEPVSPKPKIILLGGLLMGLLIPFGMIYGKNLLNNKVNGRNDLEKQVRQIPLVAEIPKLARSQKELIEANDRSVLAESFRILHTNLQYLLVNSGKDRSNKGNTIFVTSTIKGEGKTFTAFNLALTLAHADRKVVIVGGDLRNPQLQRFETGARENRGVSDYLVNKNLELSEFIQQSQLHKNLNILPSGSIPPNPSELWRQERAAVLFAELEERFDYVIVDTAPAMLVTDTFLINKYADLTLYMVRAGHTEKKLLDFPVEAKQQGKLKDVGFILNDVDATQFGYGNKYGYYYAYGEDKPSLWNKIKNRAAFW